MLARPSCFFFRYLPIGFTIFGHRSTLVFSFIFSRLNLLILIHYSVPRRGGIAGNGPCPLLAVAERLALSGDRIGKDRDGWALFSH
jgi:hypothetical protein